MYAVTCVHMCALRGQKMTLGPLELGCRQFELPAWVWDWMCSIQEHAVLLVQLPLQPWMKTFLRNGVQSVTCYFFFFSFRMKRKFYSWEECMNLREVKVFMNLPGNNSVWLISIAVFMARFRVAVVIHLHFFANAMKEKGYDTAGIRKWKITALLNECIITRILLPLMDFFNQYLSVSVDLVDCCLRRCHSYPLRHRKICLPVACFS